MMFHSGFLEELTTYLVKMKYNYQYIDRKNLRLLEVGIAGKKIRFGAAPISLWPVNNQLSDTIVKDKELTFRMCMDIGLSVPESETGVASLGPYENSMNKPKLMKDVAMSFKYQYTVIKPNDSRSANGLSFLYGKKYINEAIEIASRYGNLLTIQEQLFGTDMRYYYLGMQPVAKIMRSYTEDIVQRPEYDLSVKSYLSEGGNTITQNPYRVSNYSIAKKFPMIYRDISNSERILLYQIAQHFQLHFFAVDCIVIDNIPFVLEINSNPGVEVFYRQDKGSLGYKIFEDIVEGCIELMLDSK